MQVLIGSAEGVYTPTYLIYYLLILYAAAFPVGKLLQRVWRVRGDEKL